MTERASNMKKSKRLKRASEPENPSREKRFTDSLSTRAVRALARR